ncbi:hypothetical protein [Bradyrhizobium sp. UFLA06-06]
MLRGIDAGHIGGSFEMHDGGYCDGRPHAACAYCRTGSLISRPTLPRRAFSARYFAMTDQSHQVDFQAAAHLYKWPSLNNSRREDRAPYMVVNGTLDQCIRDFMGKPEKTRHLYEIRTKSQPPLVPDVLSPEHVIELSRLREFL